jgi:hypothetical protein
MSTNTNTEPRRIGYLNAVLTVIAVMLGMLVVDRVAFSPAAAVAGPGDDNPKGLISAADQRKIMISELKKLTTKMESLESTIKSGNLTVKVTEMPEITLPDNP